MGDEREALEGRKESPFTEGELEEFDEALEASSDASKPDVQKKWSIPPGVDPEGGHSLSSGYTFWFVRRSGTRSQENYANAIKRIGGFRTVRLFYRGQVWESSDRISSVCLLRRWRDSGSTTNTLYDLMIYRMRQTTISSRRASSLCGRYVGSALATCAITLHSSCPLGRSEHKRRQMDHPLEERTGDQILGGLGKACMFCSVLSLSLPPSLFQCLCMRSGGLSTFLTTTAPGHPGGAVPGGR